MAKAQGRAESMCLYLEVSPGEAIDKPPVLLIRQPRLRDPAALVHLQGKTASLKASRDRVTGSAPARRCRTVSLEQVHDRRWPVDEALFGLDIADQKSCAA